MVIVLIPVGWWEKRYQGDAQQTRLCQVRSAVNMAFACILISTVSIKRIGKPRIHCGHMRRMPKDIPAKLRYLSESNVDEIARLDNAYTSASAGRTFAHVNFGETLTRS